MFIEIISCLLSIWTKVAFCECCERLFADILCDSLGKHLSMTKDNTEQRNRNYQKPWNVLNEGTMKQNYFVF